MRAFLALFPPPPVLPGLLDWQERLRESLPGADVRWTPPGQMHLTLRFFANLDEDEVSPLCAAVETAVQSFAPFPLALGPAGCFPHAGRPRVLWVGLLDEAETLARLFESVSRVASGIGEAVEPPAFRPHITIGRIARMARRPSTPLDWTPKPADSEAGGQGVVDQLHLMRSTPCRGGVQYDSLASFALNGGRDS